MSTAIQSFSQLSPLPPRDFGRALSLAVFELTDSERPSVVSSLPFAEQVRRALIRNRTDTMHSEAITGKMVNGTPLLGHEHAHYFATDEDGDGRLDHVTIYCPRGFDEADLEALGGLRTIYRQGNRPEVRMVLLELSAKGKGVRAKSEGQRAKDEGQSGKDEEAGRDARCTIRGNDLAELNIEAGRDACAPSGAPGGAPMFASSRRWRSVTPFSLPRFPYRADHKPRPSEAAEAQLIRELRSRGLPEPIAIKRIEGYQVSGRPLVRWLEFHTRRFNGTEGKGLAGFEIEFAESVAGPLALGFGCHFGLGLFMPC
jgi:CRISPR-associated protein Csb2